MQICYRKIIIILFLMFGYVYSAFESNLLSDMDVREAAIGGVNINNTARVGAFERKFFELDAVTLFQDMKSYRGSYVKVGPRWNWGLKSVYSSIGGIKTYSVDNIPQGTEQFTSLNLGLSVGAKMSSNVFGDTYVGAGLKFLKEDFGSLNIDSGAGFDIGLLWEPSMFVTLGIDFKNQLLNDIKMINFLGEYQITDENKVFFGVNSIPGLVYVNTGLEVGYSFAAFRLGYRMGPVDTKTLGFISGLTGGFSIKFKKNWEIGLAYQPIDYLGNSCYIGLKRMIGEKATRSAIMKSDESRSIAATYKVEQSRRDQVSVSVDTVTPVVLPASPVPGVQLPVFPVTKSTYDIISEKLMVLNASDINSQGDGSNINISVQILSIDQLKSHLLTISSILGQYNDSIIVVTSADQITNFLSTNGVLSVSTDANMLAPDDSIGIKIIFLSGMEPWAGLMYKRFGNIFIWKGDHAELTLARSDAEYLTKQINTLLGFCETYELILKVTEPKMADYIHQFMPTQIVMPFGENSSNAIVIYIQKK